MRLLLLRHGQTDWNAAERYQGRTDIVLNATGVLQAEEAARRLTHEPVDAVYASPLGRARHTAEIAVQDRGLSITLDDGLMETAGGEWEGLTYPEIAARWPEEFAAWRAAHPEHGPVGGETPGQAGQRVVQTLLGFLAGRGDDHILVVAHGGCLRAATALLTGAGPQAYADFERLQNGRLIVLEGSFATAARAGEAPPFGEWNVVGYNV